MALPASLTALQSALASHLDDAVASYSMPARWLNPMGPAKSIAVNPWETWHGVISNILAQPAAEMTPAATNDGSWSQHAVIYNMFLRSALAFDHDGDGVLGRPNADGFTETGTFLKALCLLPYIKSLGCNTIHLLPVTAIGQDGNKGDAGSPYAIRNPYKLDANLAEAALGLGVEAEFAAFVAAAHHLGMRIVLEFVFRTASKDADIVKAHPEWFHWIDTRVEDRQPGSEDEEAYGMPIFTPVEAQLIQSDIKHGKLGALLPPHQTYRDMFLPIPDSADVEMRDGRWIASYPDGREGRIPGAFADWPVDDNQPPWGDVTYLRMYNHPSFNYIAYNTIRMYDTRYAAEANIVHPLWEYIVNIIPHWQNSYGIDGAMIDMGHALPAALRKRLIETARANNPDFGFWDENFHPSQKSIDEGYNAIMGGIPFLLPKPDEFQAWLHEFMTTEQPVHMFGATENHNTPRAAARPGAHRYSRFAIAIAGFLPTLPFIHCGMECGETYPVNTGLDFTDEMLANYVSEELPLFSARAYDWTNRHNDLTEWVRQTLTLRAKHPEMFANLGPDTIGPLGSDNPHIQGILRRTADWSIKIGLIYNTDMENAHSVWLPLPTGREQLMDHYSGRYINVSQAWIHAQLGPSEVVWYEL